MKTRKELYELYSSIDRDYEFVINRLEKAAAQGDRTVIICGGLPQSVIDRLKGEGFTLFKSNNILDQVMVSF